MSMKRTDLVKLQAVKVREAIKKAPVPGRFAADGVPDRREQRRLDQAAGLVPFACKLPSELIQTLRELAVEENGNLNAVTERLIRAGLSASGSKVKPKAVAKEAVKTPAKTPVKKAVAPTAAKTVKAAKAKPEAAKTAAAEKPVAQKAVAKKAAVKKVAETKAAAKPAAKKTVAKKKAKQT